MRDNLRCHAMRGLEARRPATYGGMGDGVDGEACRAALRVASSELEASLLLGLQVLWTAACVRCRMDFSTKCSSSVWPGTVQDHEPSSGYQASRRTTCRAHPKGCVVGCARSGPSRVSAHPHGWVAVAPLTHRDLLGLETMVLRAVWGGTRLSRAKEVVFVVPTPGHRISLVIHTEPGLHCGGGR